MHNREAGDDGYLAYGYGYFIRPANSGFRTILAYVSEERPWQKYHFVNNSDLLPLRYTGVGHTIRKNIYSSSDPTVLFNGGR